MNSLSVSWIHYVFIIYFANSLFLSNCMHSFYMFHPDKMSFSTLCSYYVIDIDYVIICSANKLWIHYLFRYYTINSLSVSRILYLFCESTMFLANSLWIYLGFRNSRWIFAKLLWIHCLFREFTINSLSLSRI